MLRLDLQARGNEQGDSGPHRDGNRITTEQMQAVQLTRLQVTTQITGTL